MRSLRQINLPSIMTNVRIAKTESLDRETAWLFALFVVEGLAIEHIVPPGEHRASGWQFASFESSGWNLKSDIKRWLTRTGNSDRMRSGVCI